MSDGAPPWEWHDAPGAHWAADERGFTVSAGERSDWFIDPTSSTHTASAPLLLASAPDEAELVARVRVELGATFDAAALFVHGGPTEWAKLALERSVGGIPTVVSVVTDQVSDDANGPEVASAAVSTAEIWLRILRRGPSYAFHFSPDGAHWRMVRLFRLPRGGQRLGLSVQSPTGRGTHARFEDVRLRRWTVGDLRAGE